MKRSCFCCDEKIRSEGSDFINPPINATHWTTSGNFGSNVFDSFTESEKLEMYICDNCLLKKAKSVYYFKPVRISKIEEIKTFDKEINKRKRISNKLKNNRKKLQ